MSADASASRTHSQIRRQPPSVSNTWAPGTPGSAGCVHSRCPRPSCVPPRSKITARQLPVPASIASVTGSLMTGAQHLGIDHVQEPASGLEALDLLGHHRRTAVERLERRPADVRGRHDVGQAEQRVDLARRTRAEDVERSPREVPCGQRREQRLLIDQGLARGVDEERAAGHAGELRLAEVDRCRSPVAVRAARRSAPRSSSSAKPAGRTPSARGVVVVEVGSKHEDLHPDRTRAVATRRPTCRSPTSPSVWPPGRGRTTPRPRTSTRPARFPPARSTAAPPGTGGPA